MSGPHTIGQQKTFERLAGFVSLRGWKDFEVSLDSDELRIQRHGGHVACTVIMLSQEPTFQARFVFATTSVHAISFTIGGEAVSQTVPAATKSFSSIDEAAQWLLEFLESAPA